MPNGEKISDKP